MAGLPFLVTGQRHRDELGQLAAVLDAAGCSCQFVQRGRAAAAFTPADYAGLILLGDSRDWVTAPLYRHDRARLAAALAAGRPVLGACYGAQLLAAHLAGLTDYGPLCDSWNDSHSGHLTEVELTGDGRADPVTAALATRRVVMAHQDSFPPPPGATPLAWSVGVTPRHCEAFRVGPPEHAVYGLLFHPEPTPAMLRAGWLHDVSPAEDLAAVAATGRAVLAAWVRLATARAGG